MHASSGEVASRENRPLPRCLFAQCCQHSVAHQNAGNHFFFGSRGIRDASVNPKSPLLAQALPWAIGVRKLHISNGGPQSPELPFGGHSRGIIHSGFSNIRKTFYSTYSPTIVRIRTANTSPKSRDKFCWENANSPNASVLSSELTVDPCALSLCKATA
jgi:hypothetical protein